MGIVRTSAVVGMLVAAGSCNGQPGSVEPRIVNLSASDLSGLRPMSGQAIYLVRAFVVELGKHTPLVEGRYLRLTVPGEPGIGISLADLYVPARRARGGGVSIVGDPDFIGAVSIGPPWNVVVGRYHYVLLAGSLSRRHLGVVGRSDEYVMRPFVVQNLWTSWGPSGAMGKGDPDLEAESLLRRAERGEAYGGTEFDELLRKGMSRESGRDGLHIIQCVLFAALRIGKRDVARHALRLLKERNAEVSSVHMSRSLLGYLNASLGVRGRARALGLWQRYLFHRFEGR